MTEQLDLGKKVSLAGIADGWDDECYALLMPATYADMLAADGVSEKPKAEQINFQIELLKQKFISGKVRAGGRIVDMKADHVGASIAITDRLFASFLGEDADPKADTPVPSPANKPQSAEQPTETPSSRVSVESPEPTSGS